MRPEAGRTLPVEVEFEFAGFDADEAFQGALLDVMSDEALALNEKVRRTEFILEEASSPAYRDFVDFRSMAAQIEDCSQHNHSLNQALRANESVSSFMDAHDHRDESTSHNHSSSNKSENNKDEKNKKKKKKFRGWFRLSQD
jgi:hypothetical protein